MEPKFQTSFIPKQSLQTAPKGPALSGYVSRRTVHGPGYYSTFLLFGIALLVSGGVFFYTKYLENTVDAKITQIDLIKTSLEPSTLKDLARLDQRMETALYVIEHHSAPSALLELLSTVTLQKVMYDGVKFDRLSDGAGTKLNISGRSINFEQVMLQSEEYKKNNFMRTVVMSGLNKNEQGQAVFGATIDLDPSLTNFMRVAASYTASQPARTQVPSAGATSSATSTAQSTSTPKVSTTTTTTN